MVNLKDVATSFAPTSAYDVLSMLVFNCGEEAVRAALDEIAAQQSVQRTATNSGGSVKNDVQPIKGTGGKGYSRR